MSDIKPERYQIDAEGLTAAIAELVKQIRTHDPSLGGLKCVCHDGTRVTIKVGNGPIGAKKPVSDAKEAVVASADRLCGILAAETALDHDEDAAREALLRDAELALADLKDCVAGYRMRSA